MKPKLSPADLELYRITDEVLHYLWDSIGVAGEPETRNEYHDYVGETLRLLKRVDSEAQVARYLEVVQTEQMGIERNQQKCARIASILTRWKSHIEEPNKNQGGERI